MDENNSAPRPWEEPVPTPEPVAPVPQPVTPVEQPTAPAEAPKKDNKITLILVGAVVLVAVIIGVIFIAMNNTKSPAPTATVTTTTTTNTKDDEPEKNEDDIVAQSINTEISNDLSFVVTSINNYQSNNRGAIPTIEIVNNESDAKNVRSWRYFIDNYLDYNATVNGGEKFSETYTIKTCNYFEGTCPKLADLNWAQNKYTIYIATKATCSKTGEVEMSESQRSVAVFSVKKPYSTMTNKYYCLNN